MVVLLHKVLYFVYVVPCIYNSSNNNNSFNFIVRTGQSKYNKNNTHQNMQSRN